MLIGQEWGYFGGDIREMVGVKVPVHREIEGLGIGD